METETMLPFGLTKCATIPFKTYYFTFALVLKVFLSILCRLFPEDTHMCGPISYILKAYYCNIRHLNVQSFCCFHLHVELAPCLVVDYSKLFQYSIIPIYIQQDATLHSLFYL
jgi:hypothetical protein